MYFLANRDIELSCDEKVVRVFGDLTWSNPEGNLVFALGQNYREFKGLTTSGVGKGYFKQELTVIEDGTYFVYLANQGMAKKDIKELSGTISLPKVDLGLTDDEVRKLLDFQFEGYEKMTVEEYQNKAWKLLDAKDYRKLLEKATFGQQFFLSSNRNNIASFVYNILIPLTSENWKINELRGDIRVPSGLKGIPVSNMAELSYYLPYIIAEADELTVGEYKEAGEGIMEGLRSFTNQKTNEQLSNKEEMNKTIYEEITKLLKNGAVISLNLDSSGLTMWSYMNIVKIPYLTLRTNRVTLSALMKQ